MSFVVAIDGPAGSGKGTITKLVAKKLNLVNVDTGAMYRCVALKALRNDIDSTEIKKIEELLSDITIEIKREGENQIIFLDGEDVSNQIRTPEVDACVAKFAALACVRNKVTPLQRKMGERQDIIMEGRDIGTTVFPNADVKIYLDASVEERANRRYKQDLEKGMKVTYEEILESIKKRHKLETEREIAPLVQAEDAIYIDSSNMTIEEVVNKVIEIVNGRKRKN
ncbi:MAG: (d)CMP kinase [Clostridia bacterium]